MYMYKKVRKNEFFNLINNQHENIKFTLEEQKNFELNFLDMTIFKNKNIYELKNYKKPSASKVLTNFYSETPNKYKLSSLIGSIYRANDTCTN